jgi:hypothetical protein
MKRFWLLAALSAMFISCSQELTPKGDLTVSSVGLPATESVQVTITGPNGFSDQITLNGSDSVTLNRQHGQRAGHVDFRRARGFVERHGWR